MGEPNVALMCSTLYRDRARIDYILIRLWSRKNGQIERVKCHIQEYYDVWLTNNENFLTQDVRSD